VVDLPGKRRAPTEGEPAGASPARAVEPEPASGPAKSTSEAPAAAIAPSAEELLRPLSDFAAAREAPADFRPALEVPYFLWPEVCRTIVAERREHLARLAETLRTLGAGARVAVTSRERGEGRTTLVACLAAYLVQSETTCCLVDADFGRPQLARRLGVQPQVGWEEVLCGQVPLSEALVESGRDRCALLPLANPQPADVQSLGKLQAGVDLGVLGEHYALVLLDAGPWEGLAALALQMLCRQGAIDALLIVTDRRRPEQDLATLADDLQATGVRLVGIVENFTTVGGTASR
jgi:Mrp family chromosome partitioning ATPase